MALPAPPRSWAGFALDGGARRGGGRRDGASVVAGRSGRGAARRRPGDVDPARGGRLARSAGWTRRGRIGDGAAAGRVDGRRGGRAVGGCGRGAGGRRAGGGRARRSRAAAGSPPRRGGRRRPRVSRRPPAPDERWCSGARAAPWGRGSPWPPGSGRSAARRRSARASRAFRHGGSRVPVRRVAAVRLARRGPLRTAPLRSGSPSVVAAAVAVVPAGPTPSPRAMTGPFVPVAAVGTFPLRSGEAGLAATDDARPIVADGAAGVVSRAGVVVATADGRARVLARPDRGAPAPIGVVGDRVVRWISADSVAVTGLRAGSLGRRRGARRQRGGCAGGRRVGVAALRRGPGRDGSPARRRPARR